MKPPGTSTNTLFRGESNLMLASVLLLLALGFVAVLVGPSVATWIAVDRCLDAGGRYDYQTEKCVKAPAELVQQLEAFRRDIGAYSSSKTYNSVAARHNRQGEIR